jgi:hypothetical protein
MHSKYWTLTIAVTTVLLIVSGGQTTAQDEQKRFTSTFNQQWLDLVVSIEMSEAGKALGPIGTGFLVQTLQKHVLLVTAKHILENRIRVSTIRLGYRLNTTGTSSVIIWDDELHKQGLGGWHLSPTADVACRFTAWPESSQPMTMTSDNFLSAEALMAGAPLLVLGFPLGLRQTEHARPIAKHGIVGRVEPNVIIADVFVFPGNSGGPVIYNPPFKPGRGLSSQLIPEEKLIGIVASYVPYQEPAISTHTGRTRVIFEENSGLANIVPVDRLIELIGSEAVMKTESGIPSPSP